MLLYNYLYENTRNKMFSNKWDSIIWERKMLEKQVKYETESALIQSLICAIEKRCACGMLWKVDQKLIKFVSWYSFKNDNIYVCTLILHVHT